MGTYRTMVEYVEESFMCFTPTLSLLNYITCSPLAFPSICDLRCGWVSLGLIKPGILIISTVFQVRVLGKDRLMVQAKDDLLMFTGLARLILKKLFQN